MRFKNWTARYNLLLSRSRCESDCCMNQMSRSLRTLWRFAKIVRCKATRCHQNGTKCGRALSPSNQIRDGVVRLRAPFSPSQTHLCDCLARLTAVDMPHNGPLLSGNWTTLNIDVWIWCSSGRALAIMATEPESSFFYFDCVSRKIVSPEIPAPNSYRIVGVWVATACRGIGVSTTLVEEAAKLYCIDPKSFIHSPPFTEDGLAFAAKWSNGQIRVDRYRHPLVY